MIRAAAAMLGCIALHAVHAQQPRSPAPPFRLITLDPGHFHAALVQKFMYADVDPRVHVYAPPGPDLAEHLKRIDAFNRRADEPTRWEQVVYTGNDYLEKMLADRPGNIVVLAGNNARKTEYILRAVEAGLHVLADKPMVITPANLPRLEQAFATAARKGVLLADIMTERFEIASLLQRELSREAALFGSLVPGSPDDPAITKISVHHFFKTVAGAPLVRPQWFLDVTQEGEGIVDVSTHLVDLIQWAAFPEQALQPSDATVLRARRWATPMTREQFARVTGAGEFPAFLRKDVRDGLLHVFANGEFDYRLRNVHARVSVTWDFEAPPGGGDTHCSVMRGTRANLIIRQGAEERYRPVLYVERAAGTDAASLESSLARAITALQGRYPGIGVGRHGEMWLVTVPERYHVGHEAHFAQVTSYFLDGLRAGRLPAWEVPNMLTRYATLMQAYERSR